MISPNVPRNAYTDSPEQHPNLILGSLQLLFWIFFHPSAWQNHLKRIDPALDTQSNRNRGLRWQNPALWKLLIQAFLVLPVLANSIVVALVLWLLGAPVEKIASGMGRGVASGMASGMALGVAWGVALGVALGVAWGVASGVASGVAFGVTSGVVWGVTSGVASGVAFRVASGVVWGAALGVASGVALGVAFRVALSVALGVASRPTSGVVSPVASRPTSGVVSPVALSVALGVALGLALVMALRVASGLPSGVVSPVASSLGISINLWLPVLLYPFLTGWNILLYLLDKGRTATKLSFLRWHSAFWDEWQPLPLQGLDKHVLLVIERNPEEGKAALTYVSTSLQRWAAQAVQIELDARELENCTDVRAISNAHRSIPISELNSPVSALLSSFSYISQDVDAALNQKSPYNQRLALCAVAEKLNNLIRELTRSSDKYSVRFRPIATYWSEIVTNQIRELAEAVELRQEIDNPYITGVPLTEQQEIFTGRTDIGTRIEQLLLDRRRPPLLLYGQRRMGKTSLLNNLGRLLPSTIIPMFVDFQGPVSSTTDYAGFLYNIARDMAKSAQRQSALTLPSLDRETLQDDPFTRFDEWLDEVEQVLQQNIALLALDEFEALDDAIRKGRFDEQDVLGMLRHLIQHRPRFKVLLAGSHTIEEFQRWASYLINVQVVHISYLKQAEARQLIEQPVKDFTLRYEPNGVERVLQLTRCHPFLIQLLCTEIIALKNEQDPSIRRLATLADVEAAIPEALSVGSFFFADIQSNQADAAALAILQFLAAQGEGAIVSRLTILQHFPDKSDALNLLLQRELIEEVSEGYRFQVELIRRWFA
ncbi:AAA family ATPase [Microcoleus sp. MON1_C1]|uniref:AAA family ATPase n=1 Tax=Microcoleus sp. MON1_C1 TaxID=2818827 RepID=UPI002FD74303